MLSATGGLLLYVLAAADKPAQAPLVAPIIGGKPAAAERRYDLRPAKQGGYDYDDTRFAAHIAPDGRVTFSDKGIMQGMRWIPYLPEPHPPGTETLEGTVRGLLGRRKPGSDGPPPPLPAHYQKSPTDKAAAPLDRREEEWRAATRKNLPLFVNDKLDLTDAYYRLFGEDPYRYEKARFLAATFDVRLLMAARAQAADLRRALPEIPKRLAEIWADRSQPAPARRRLICELWADLRQDSAAEAGVAALISFVRTQLPEGSPHAYSSREIGACNLGQPEGAVFAPYAAKP